MMMQQRMISEKVRKLTVMTIFCPILKFDRQFCSKKILHTHFCTFVTCVVIFCTLTLILSMKMNMGLFVPHEMRNGIENENFDISRGTNFLSPSHTFPGPTNFYRSHHYLIYLHFPSLSPYPQFPPPIPFPNSSQPKRLYLSISS